MEPLSVKTRSIVMPCAVYQATASRRNSRPSRRFRPKISPCRRRRIHHQHRHTEILPAGVTASDLPCSGLFVPNALNFAMPLDIQMEHLSRIFPLIPQIGSFSPNKEKREKPGLCKIRKTLPRQTPAISSPVSRSLCSNRVAIRLCPVSVLRLRPGRELLSASDSKPPFR